VVLPHRRRPGLHARAGLAQRPADAGALRPDRDVPGERRQQPHRAGRGSALLGWDLHRGAPGTRQPLPQPAAARAGHGVVRGPLPALLPARHHRRTSGDAGADLRLPGREPDEPRSTSTRASSTV
jgi:hypothetical protein